MEPWLTLHRIERQHAPELGERRAPLDKSTRCHSGPVSRRAATGSGRPAGTQRSTPAGWDPARASARPEATNPRESITSQNRCLSKSRASCSRRIATAVASSRSSGRTGTRGSAGGDATTSAVRPRSRPPIASFSCASAPPTLAAHHPRARGGARVRRRRSSAGTDRTSRRKKPFGGVRSPSSGSSGSRNTARIAGDRRARDRRPWTSSTIPRVRQFAAAHGRPRRLPDPAPPA